ncbi:unnamed protein product [Somion occarium]|uniref:tRNA-dihydrouridine(47) synthase [NAD(P)(+)] n=1 Tax=Somion occarium TaxID=3059160 RepID=A0ABP1DR69_9APHY
MMSELLPGTAPIRADFLLSAQPRAVPDDDAAEGSTSHAVGHDARAEFNDSRSLSGAQRRKLTKEERKNRTGSNKGRRFQKIRDEVELCWKVANGKTCEFGAECRNTHDVTAYLAAKPKDIHFPSLRDLGDTPPFVKPFPDEEIMTDAENPSLDFSTSCPVFEAQGECNTGLKCRFLGAHVRKLDSGNWKVTVDEEKRARAATTEKELNFIDGIALKQVRSKKYPHPITDAYLKELKIEEAKTQSAPKAALKQAVFDVADLEQSNGVSGCKMNDRTSDDAAEDLSEVDTPDVPIRPIEKKRLNWYGLTYLAPLTTVGNLPFRRLCVDYGADITCGEMGLANSFLGGSKEEWSLVRRHPSERTFGMQIAGSKPSLLVPAAEIIAKECGANLDFVDINCGCPIDLVYKTGSGSALLDSAGRLGKIIVGMNKALGDIPVTVKLRTGVKDGRNNAHKLMPRLSCEWNTAALTLHGRTRQQRYSRLADWDYVKQCVSAVRAREVVEDLTPVPIFGGGDCFSSQDYWEKMEYSGVDGIMIGRGALIKPWIFTEVKERREWDISARERLELIRKSLWFGHTWCKYHTTLSM